MTNYDLSQIDFNDPEAVARLSDLIGQRYGTGGGQPHTVEPRQVPQPVTQEFQGVGKYATPEEFAYRDPAGFAKVNPQLAQSMQTQGQMPTTTADYLRYNPQVSMEQAKVMFDYEKSRGGRGDTATGILRRNDGNFDLAGRDMQLRTEQNAVGQTVRDAFEAAQLKRQATLADLAYKQAQIANLSKPKDPQWDLQQTDAGLVRINKGTGEAEPVLLGGKVVGGTSKPPTEFQVKSAGYGARAAEADRIIGELEQSGDYSRLGATMAGGNGIVNTLMTPVLSASTQKAIQAQRNFVNAILRQESGAAISASEFDNASRQYFQQPGDSPEVTAQKAGNRQMLVQGLMSNAGRAGTPGAPAASVAPGNAPTPSPSSTDYQQTFFNAKKMIAKKPTAREGILQKMRAAGYDTRGL
jgi:hypothetical protein